MKKIFITLLLAIGLISFRSSAQVSINVNIGSQPLWGPVGYDHVDYYYLPDIESYYYVPKRQFIYMDNGRWNFSVSLPSRYRGYDLYSGYKVVINSRDAYHNFDNDRVRYGKYKKSRGQKAIKYSDDPRYYVVKGHPHGTSPGQAKKMDSRKNDVGKGKGHGAGKGNGKGKH
jgi:hypothetical protein